jgi:soluble lytic murein transglycosylase-like protein
MGPTPAWQDPVCQTRRNLKLLRTLCAISVLALGVARPAEADSVRLANGQTIVVDSVTFDGEFVVFNFPRGSSIRTLRSLVVEILPDEEPGARDMALRILEASAAAGRPQPMFADLIARIDKAALKVGLDPRLAHAIVRTESNYQTLAVSPRGAMGLMQIMPVVAREYSVRDPFDVDENLDAGLRHLKRLISRHRTLSLALAAYNAGEGAVARYGRIPPYRETEDYVRKVIALYR